MPKKVICTPGMIRSVKLSSPRRIRPVRVVILVRGCRPFPVHQPDILKLKLRAIACRTMTAPQVNLAHNSPSVGVEDPRSMNSLKVQEQVASDSRPKLRLTKA